MRCSCMLKSSLGMSGPTLQDSGMKSFWMLNLDDVHPCLVDAKICSIPTVDAKDDFLISEIC